MDINNNIIKTKIFQYINKEITKIELSEWARNSFYTLLSTGEIFEVKKLVTYKFLIELSQVDDCDEPCTVEDMKSIIDILNGGNNIKYIHQMKIPPKFQNNEFFPIRDCLLKYKENDVLTKSDMIELESYSRNVFLPIDTINDHLSAQLSALLSCAFTFYSDDDEINKM